MFTIVHPVWARVRIFWIIYVFSLYGLTRCFRSTETRGFVVNAQYGILRLILSYEDTRNFEKRNRAPKNIIVPHSFFSKKKYTTQ